MSGSLGRILDMGEHRCSFVDLKTKETIQTLVTDGLNRS